MWKILSEDQPVRQAFEDLERQMTNLAQDVPK